MIQLNTAKTLPIHMLNRQCFNIKSKGFKVKIYLFKE